MHSQLLLGGMCVRMHACDTFWNSRRTVMRRTVDQGVCVRGCKLYKLGNGKGAKMGNVEGVKGLNCRRPQGDAHWTERDWECGAMRGKRCLRDWEGAFP